LRAPGERATMQGEWVLGFFTLFKSFRCFQREENCHEREKGYESFAA
jgi:hypothetical protein